MSGSGDISLPINIRNGRAQFDFDPLGSLVAVANTAITAYDAYKNEQFRAETQNRLSEITRQNERLNENYNNLDKKLSKNQQEM